MRGVDYEKMGKRVRQYRKKAGLTQQQVAETIEIEASNMSHIERGKIKTSLNTILNKSCCASRIGKSPTNSVLILITTPGRYPV